MNAYEQKQERRAERYEELSKAHSVKSDEMFNSHNRETVRGMMGEPIKVGHHSEGRHRRLLERAENDTRKAVEHHQLSEYYADKAESVRNNKSISSDDPDAIKKLTEKLTALQHTHEMMKKANAEARKAGEDKPHPTWQLQNSNKNIKTVKERIEKLSKARDAVSQELFKVEGCSVYDNVEDNRLQLIFEEKPSEEVRKKLKSNGFRWSPRAGAWQCMRSNRANYRAKLILGVS